MNERIDFLREKANKLPPDPGVYLMKDAGGKIIYVGKAKALKNRVTSYFRHNSGHNAKTLKLVSKINDFDFIVTRSELDALVLECSLIKLHQPKYNILLKDDKGYNYIKITRGEFPRISYALQTDDKNADYIGPFTSGYTVKQTVEEANTLFMLPTCKRVFPRDFGRERPCLNHHIKRCMGVCEGKISSEEYKKIVDEAIEYLKSGSRQSVEELTAEMERAAEALEFEKAARIRDRIAAVTRLANGQTIFDGKQEFDVIGGAQNVGMASFAVIKYRNGRLVDKENFFIGEEYEPAAMRRDFLLGYYTNREDIPKDIFVDEPFDDAELLAQLLREQAGRVIRLLVPQRGDGLSRTALARKNAGEYLALKIGRTQKEIRALEDLQKLLGLPKIPDVIECYDISNFGETGVVGGMVVYKNGRPFKAGYRRFSIKTVEGQDDYACMQEVLRRRITRFLEGDEGFSLLPDLILLDGGRGHISAVGEVFEELNVDIPLFGLVKDSKHRTRAIAKQADRTSENERTNGGTDAADSKRSFGEIEIKSNRALFSLLTNIQDEVHRYAITYQRVKHKQAMFASELTRIKGIGKAKQTALLKQFKTKQALKNASLEELRECAKVSEETAKALFDYIGENF